MLIILHKLENSKKDIHMVYFDWHHHISARSEFSNFLWCSSRKLDFYNMTIMIIE